MNKNINESNYQFEDDINLKEIINFLFTKKYSIFFITSFFAILSVIYSLSIPNQYTSTALLAPTSQDNSLSSKLGNYSSLARVAGISVGGETASKTEEGIARLKSYDFFVNRFIPRINYENLVAQKSWDATNNLIEYDEEIFDRAASKLESQDGFIVNAKPSYQKAYDVYREILGISTDDSSGFTSISIKHISPYKAQAWLQILIFEINNYMRELDQLSADNSIRFLNMKASSTNLSELNEAIADLLKIQMQTLMLAESNEDYIFKPISSPIVPEKKSEPSRAILCISGTILGFIIIIFYHLCIFFFRFEEEG